MKNFVQMIKDKALGVQNAAPCTLRDDIEMHLAQYFAAHSGDNLPAPGLYGRILPLVEKPLLEMTLRATGGNQIKAAHILGINRNTLRKKIGELGITLSDKRDE